MSEEKNLPAGDAARQAPLFTEEAAEEARPVVPLRTDGGDGPSAGPGRGGLARNLTLALAVTAAGAAGAAVGYLTLTWGAPEPPAEATTEVAPEPASPQPVSSNTSDAPTEATRDVPTRAEPPARDESERPRPQETEARGGDEEDHTEREREEEEERAERAREEEERRREEAEERAERRREEAEKRAERRRDEAKRGKPKARLVGTISDVPEP